MSVAPLGLLAVKINIFIVKLYIPLSVVPSHKQCFFDIIIGEMFAKENERKVYCELRHSRDINLFVNIETNKPTTI